MSTTSTISQRSSLWLICFSFVAIIELESAMAAPCSLCLDRSGIPQSFGGKPIGLTTPTSIPTCESLEEILTIVSDDDPLCQSGQQLGPYCGCPVAANACSICYSSATNDTSTKLDLLDPTFSLDGLIENLPDMFGLSPTCELFETGLNLLNNTDDQCTDVNLSELRKHCACKRPATQTQHCSFCITGEDPIFLHPGLIYFEEDYSVLISCQDLWEISLETAPDSPSCTSIQEHSFSCNCDEVPNACPRMCDNEMLNGEAFITGADGKEYNCRNYEAKLRTIHESDPLCHVTDDMISTCGCVDKLPDNFCTLCLDGSKAGYPDKDLSEHLWFLDEYLEVNLLPKPLTCRIIEAGLLREVVGSKTCDAAQLLSKLCGCPLRENTCNLCGSEKSVMTKPLAKTLFILADSNQNVDLGFAFQDADWDAATRERPLTCESLDSAFNIAFPKDSSDCFHNQVTFGNFCGCEPNTYGQKAVILLWCQRVMALLSVIGSLLILGWILLKQKKKKRWSTYHQLLIGTSTFDVISSTALALASVMIPKNVGVDGASGNEATCRLQGFMFQLGQTSMYYNVLLSGYFLLVIKYGWTERKFQKFSKWCHGGVLFVGFALAGASIPFQEPRVQFCYVKRPPLTATFIPAVMFFIVPISISMLVITAETVAMVLFVWKKEKRTMGLSMTKSKAQLTRKTFFQSLWYLLAFYLAWPVFFAMYLMRMVQSNYWFFVTASILGPSQGLLNCIIFFHKRREALASTKLGRQMSSKFAYARQSSSAFFKKDNTDGDPSKQWGRSNSASFFTKDKDAGGSNAKRWGRARSTASFFKKEADAANDPLSPGSAKQGKVSDLLTAGRGHSEEEEAKEPERMDEDRSWSEEANMPEISRTHGSTQGGGSRWSQDHNIAENEENVTLDDGVQAFPTVNFDPATSQPSRQTARRVSIHEDVVRRQSAVITKRVSVLLGIQDLDLNLSDEDEEIGQGGPASEEISNGANVELGSGRRAGRRASLNPRWMRRASLTGSNITRRMTSLIPQIGDLDISNDDDDDDDDGSSTRLSHENTLRDDTSETEPGIGRRASLNPRWLRRASLAGGNLTRRVTSLIPGIGELDFSDDDDDDDTSSHLSHEFAMHDGTFETEPEDLQRSESLSSENDREQEANVIEGHDGEERNMCEVHSMSEDFVNMEVKNLYDEENLNREHDTGHEPGKARNNNVAIALQVAAVVEHPEESVISSGRPVEGEESVISSGGSVEEEATEEEGVHDASGLGDSEEPDALPSE